MGFKFKFLCELLQDVDNSKIEKVVSISRRDDPERRVIKDWFARRSSLIPRAGNEAVAFLSCLFPQRRVDRVYEIQEPRLASIFGRCLRLGVTRLAQLSQWRERDGLDLASCIESVMRDAENPAVLPTQEVTLEEIDNVLEQIASGKRSSSPEVRRKQTSNIDAYDVLSSIILRLRSWEAKWFVRLVLKNFDPVVLPETFTMLQFHFLLPEILRVQNSFDKALSRLEETSSLGIPNSCLKEDVKMHMEKASAQLAPQIGVYVKRPAYLKARSIKNCCKLAALRRISLERKYDGEYCQIHVDVSDGAQRIRIFSKSGKDSTKDRSGVHDALKRSLKIYQADCMIKSRCILEGELLVWNNKEQCIQPFHKIRKHVSRSGRFIGTEQDSIPDSDEHLMIMLYDLLLLDDDICLYKPHNVRRKLLRDLVLKIDGFIDIGTREVIDFSAWQAEKRLRHAFAKAITDRWEGFVLKGCNDPYYPAYGLIENGAATCIKLKKDYIASMGDTVDFVVLGARYDAKNAHALRDEGLSKVRYTSFHVACLENKQHVVALREKPRFRIVDVLNHHNIAKEDITELNRLGEYEEVQFPSEEAFGLFDIATGSISTPTMTQLFRKPFVLEMIGGGFDKPPNVSFRTLRFPRSSRLHLDRTFESATSFAELQAMADAADSIPKDESQEDREWIQRLQRQAERRRYIVDNSQSSSPRSNPDIDPLQLGIGHSQAVTSPVALVRMDSSELRPDEFRSPDGHVLKTNMDDTNIPNPKTRKRKLSSRYSPFEGVHPTKRVRASPPILQRHLRKMSKSKAPDLSDLALQLDSPLKEICNCSPTRSRRSQQWPAPSVKEKDPEAPREESEPLPVLTACQSRQPLNEGFCVEQRPLCFSEAVTNASLPTPPLSSPEQGKKEIHTGNSSEPKMPSHSRPQIQQPGVGVSAHQESSFSAQPARADTTLIHVGERLCKVSRRHRFHDLIRNVNSPLIYSCKYFVQQLVLASLAADSTLTFGMVLVRAAQPNETAEALTEIKQAVTELKQAWRPNRVVNILFMDWRFLTNFQDDNETSIAKSERRAKFVQACFAGALRWAPFKASHVSIDVLHQRRDDKALVNECKQTTTRDAEISVHFEREEFWEQLDALDRFISPP